MVDKIYDAYLGTILGGAIGDALGYAVEFIGEDEIFSKYGNDGICEYELTDGVALISDDTQMSLFTADGLLRSDGENIVKNIHASYLDWLKTQSYRKSVKESGLLSYSELFSPRAPGGTCLSALESGKCGTIGEPINNSKGCGGIMRVAPVTLYCYKNTVPIEKADMLSAESSAITHGHPLGYIPSMTLSHIIYEILLGKDIEESVTLALCATEKLFSANQYTNELVRLIKRAVLLANSDTPDLDAIHLLGEGWVAEETLAIAVFSVVRYSRDFVKCVRVAVNHNGDSDSTGAVAGNIVGAYLGASAIPKKYIKSLELSTLITNVAKSLYENRITY